MLTSATASATLSACPSSHALALSLALSSLMLAFSPDTKPPQSNAGKAKVKRALTADTRRT